MKSKEIWDAEDCALLLIDYQPEVLEHVHERDIKLMELNVIALAKMAVGPISIKAIYWHTLPSCKRYYRFQNLRGKRIFWISSVMLKPNASTERGIYQQNSLSNIIVRWPFRNRT